MGSRGRNRSRFRESYFINNLEAKLDKQALIGTILLHEEFGGFAAPLGDINRLVDPCENCLYDDRFWKAAVRGSEF